jgi:hypothetical protein
MGIDSAAVDLLLGEKEVARQKFIDGCIGIFKEEEIERLQMGFEDDEKLGYVKVAQKEVDRLKENLSEMKVSAEGWERYDLLYRTLSLIQ